MRWALIPALLLWPAAAHELQENRATLVLRDKTHIAVTMCIAYGDALHLALMPQRPLASFLVIYSAMKPEDLRKQLLRAQEKFQSSTRLYLSPGPGREIPITNWIWPDAKQVQALLQQRIMAAVADPNGHSHEQPIESTPTRSRPQRSTASPSSCRRNSKTSLWFPTARTKSGSIAKRSRQKSNSDDYRRGRMRYESAISLPLSAVRMNSTFASSRPTDTRTYPLPPTAPPCV